MRGSDWLSFRRCLALVRRLLKGPATPSELILFVLETEGETAYPVSKSAREKAFKRDRESLRTRLGVAYQYSPSKAVYTLIDPGPLVRTELSDSSLHALAILKQTFDGQMGDHSEIQKFLNELSSSLPLEKRQYLEDPTLPIDLA
ncbi:MAG: hypothetical protein NTW32_21615, partial [Chloroflexi bacterium]|nr:hypothetical protein [Chloroflexota bacterium]